MKKIITLGLLLFTIVANILCQPPQSFKYQAVVRDASGEVLAGQTVNVRISIHDGYASGPIVYQETFNQTTNQFGLLDLNIGQGTPVSGTFTGINWANYAKFIEVEIDSGSGYASMGTSELLSVPYALYSERTSEGNWNSSGSNIYYDEGYVGIGTSNPVTNFVVKSSGYTHGIRVYSNDDDLLFRVRQNSDNSGGIYIYDSVGNPKINLNASFNSFLTGNFRVGNVSQLGRLTIGSEQGNWPIISFEKGLVIKDGDYNLGNDFEILSENDEMHFLVTDAGNVCIGTETPASGYKLSVDGKIACEEILVQYSESWPDYVFDKNYRLPPLKKLETDIKQKKHLPGVPSAAEIKENGIRVAEMQKILLEKIEELTLYIVEQNNRIDSLTGELNLLKNKKDNQRLIK